MARTTPPVPLHDVRDAVALVKAIVSKSNLPDNARDDAIGTLLVEIVELSEKYDPARGISFSNYATQILPRRLIDYTRRELGDSRYRTRREHVSLEEADLDSLADPYDYVEQITEAASIVDDLSRLSDRGHTLVHDVALPISQGESHDTVARRLGVRRSVIPRLLEELRNELLGLSLGLDDPEFLDTDAIVEALHTRTEDA